MIAAIGSWDWVALTGIIIGVVALVIAFPPFLHMFLRHPKVEIVFTQEHHQSSNVLKCELFNRPIRNRLFRSLGARRDTIEDLNVNYQIHEAGSQKIIVPVVLDVLVNTHSGPPVPRARLAESDFSARFGVVAWIEKQQSVMPLIDITKLEPVAGALPLEAGRYLARVTVYEPGKTTNGQREFLVGEAMDNLRWI